ncbi:hypothetical protein RI367_006155 [Sorochytrium milnesiophthora]
MLARCITNSSPLLSRRAFSVFAAMRMPVGSHMSDNDPAKLEGAKREALNQAEQGHHAQAKSSTIHNAPGWKQTLASESEASVKADKAEQSIDEMVQQTIKQVQWE